MDSIPETPEFQDQVAEHRRKHPNDPLPIPFKDPEPQVIIPYKTTSPWHVQVHRDAFSYGDVGPKADPRVVVDLRFFGKGEIVKENRVTFGENDTEDIYGMPQATVGLLPYRIIVLLIRCDLVLRQPYYGRRRT